jgi:hypothetical protein
VVRNTQRYMSMTLLRCRAGFETYGCGGLAGLEEATDAVVKTPLGQLETGGQVLTTIVRGVPVRATQAASQGL